MKPPRRYVYVAPDGRQLSVYARSRDEAWDRLYTSWNGPILADALYERPLSAEPSHVEEHWERARGAKS